MGKKMTSDQVQSLLSNLTKSLQTHGLQLLPPCFTSQLYNDHLNQHKKLDQLPRLPTFNCSNTLSALIGSTRSLWPIFLNAYHQQPTFQSSTDPLDTYITQCITRILTDLNCTIQQHDVSPPQHQGDNNKIKAQIRYTHSTGREFVNFQELAHLTGAAYFNRDAYLCVHPRYGPWFALRCVVVFDLEVSEVLEGPVWSVNQQEEGGVPDTARSMEEQEDEVGDVVAAIWPCAGVSEPKPLNDPYPESREAIIKKMQDFFNKNGSGKYDGSGKGSVMEDGEPLWKVLVNIRDIATRPECVKYRYGEKQMEYHYTKKRDCLVE